MRHGVLAAAAVLFVCFLAVRLRREEREPEPAADPADPLPGGTGAAWGPRPPNPAASAHRCVQMRSAALRSCSFRNVCVRLGDHGGEVSVHNAGAAVTVARVRYYAGAHADALPRDDNLSPALPPLALRSWDPNMREVRAEVDVVRGSPPADAPWLAADNAALIGTYWPHNWGHHLGDELFPAFRLLRRFGMLAPPGSPATADPLLIVHPNCTLGGAGPPIGCKVQAANTRQLLTRRPLLTSGSVPEGFFCARNLALGGSHYGIKHAGDGDWVYFGAHLLARAGRDPSARPRSQRILLLEKKGKRAVANVRALAAHLARTFGVPTDVLNPSDLKFPAQMDAMARTTVLITPCGGIAFSSLFLPPGAAMVYVCYHEPATGRAGSIENVFRTSTSVAALYYPTEAHEARVPQREELAALRERYGEHVQPARDLSVIEPDPRKLALVVHAALLHAEAHMGLPSPSFRPPGPGTAVYPRSAALLNASRCEAMLERAREALPGREVLASEWGFGKPLGDLAREMEGTAAKKAMRGLEDWCR